MTAEVCLSKWEMGWKFHGAGGESAECVSGGNLKPTWDGKGVGLERPFGGAEGDHGGHWQMWAIAGANLHPGKSDIMGSQRKESPACGAVTLKGEGGGAGSGKSRGLF